MNRWWIDRLDPDWPQDPTPAPPPATRPPSGADPTIEVIATPNPHALKFTAPSRLTSTPITWLRTPAPTEPLGQALMAIEGVRSAFAVEDFVTITRDPDADWDDLRPQVCAAIIAALD